MVQPALIPANGAIEAAISIAVLVIAFIGWLVQIVGQAKGTQPPTPTGRPGAGQRSPRPAGNVQRPRDERLQSEIDSFLREVSTGKKSGPRDRDEVAVEVVPVEDDVRPARRLSEQADRFAAPSESTVAKIFQEKKTPGRSEETREELQQQHQRDRILSSLRERHLDSSPLGAALQKHVEETLVAAESMRKEKQTAERKLAEATAELLSLRASHGVQGASVSTGRQSRVGALLRNRRTVKDAIVINEVLGRPKGFRRNLSNR